MAFIHKAELALILFNLRLGVTFIPCLIEHFCIYQMLQPQTAFFIASQCFCNFLCYQRKAFCHYQGRLLQTVFVTVKHCDRTLLCEALVCAFLIIFMLCFSWHGSTNLFPVVLCSHLIVLCFLLSFLVSPPNVTTTQT